MRTCTLSLDDDFDTALAAVCQERGRDKSELLVDVLRQFVEKEKLGSQVLDPQWIDLYRELAAEDQALAELGMTDYADGLRQADRA